MKRLSTVRNTLLFNVYIIRLIIAVVILLGFSLKSKAQSNSYQVYDPSSDVVNQPKLHETYLGLGYFRSFEKNVFNDSQREEASGGFGINIAYRFPIANGLHMGFELDLNSFGIKSQNNPVLEDISIVTVQAGTSGKWTAGEGKVRPFITFGVFYVFGNMLDFDGFSLNSLSGYSLMAGAGCTYPIGEGTYVLAEFKSSTGRANWLSLPSDNANDRGFNPGGLALNLGLVAQFSSFNR
jgi:hypothetical protein